MCYFTKKAGIRGLGGLASELVCEPVSGRSNYTPRKPRPEHDLDDISQIGGSPRARTVHLEQSEDNLPVGVGIAIASTSTGVSASPTRRSRNNPNNEGTARPVGGVISKNRRATPRGDGATTKPESSPSLDDELSGLLSTSTEDSQAESSADDEENTIVVRLAARKTKSGQRGYNVNVPSMVGGRVEKRDHGNGGHDGSGTTGRGGSSKFKKSKDPKRNKLERIRQKHFDAADLHLIGNVEPDGEFGERLFRNKPNIWAAKIRKRREQAKNDASKPVQEKENGGPEAEKSTNNEINAETGTGTDSVAPGMSVSSVEVGSGASSTRSTSSSGRKKEEDGGTKQAGFVPPGGADHGEQAKSATPRVRFLTEHGSSVVTSSSSHVNRARQRAGHQVSELEFNKQDDGTSPKPRKKSGVSTSPVPKIRARQGEEAGKSIASRSSTHIGTVVGQEEEPQKPRAPSSTREAESFGLDKTHDKFHQEMKAGLQDLVSSTSKSRPSESETSKAAWSASSSPTKISGLSSVRPAGAGLSVTPKVAKIGAVSSSSHHKTVGTKKIVTGDSSSGDFSSNATSSAIHREASHRVEASAGESQTRTGGTSRQQNQTETRRVPTTRSGNNKAAANHAYLSGTANSKARVALTAKLNGETASIKKTKSFMSKIFGDDGLGGEGDGYVGSFGEVEREMREQIHVGAIGSSQVGSGTGANTSSSIVADQREKMPSKNRVASTSTTERNKASNSTSTSAAADSSTSKVQDRSRNPSLVGADMQNQFFFDFTGDGRTSDFSVISNGEEYVMRKQTHSRPPGAPNFVSNAGRRHSSSPRKKHLAKLFPSEGDHDDDHDLHLLDDEIDDVECELQEIRTTDEDFWKRNGVERAVVGSSPNKTVVTNSRVQHQAQTKTKRDLGKIKFDRLVAKYDGL